MTVGSNFDQFFNPGFNRLGTMRHLLALAVLVDHAFLIQGAGYFFSATGYGVSLGGLGIAGFFVLSGALIAASWEKSGSWKRFVRGRFLRIYPGYACCLAVAALVLGPLAWIASSPAGSELRQASGYWQSDPGPFSYVWKNALLMQYQGRIGDLFSGHAQPYAINGSLWSIPWEVACYAMVAALGAIGALRVSWLVAVLAAAALLHFCYFPAGSILGLYYLSDRVMLLPIYFLCGAAFYLLRHRIPKMSALGLLAMAGLILVGKHYWPLAAFLFLPYVLFYFASLRIPEGGWAERHATDLSYGIYIYAFPIQQLLACWGFTLADPYLFSAICIAAVLPFAALSWWLVEAPCLRLKRS